MNPEYCSESCDGPKHSDHVMPLHICTKDLALASSRTED